MDENFITIQISEIDAEYFIHFQKHYKAIKRLVDDKVFEVTDGKAIINFDSGGNISSIERRFFS